MKARRGEAHVRLHVYELQCAAYRALSTDARALLVEFRALYMPGRNRVFLSVREMMNRLGIGQRKAQQARDQLLACGWIREIEKGAFHRKTKLATVYAITDQPLEDIDGAIAPKDFMRWQPERKFTVAATATYGSRHSYRDPLKRSKNERDSSRHSYRKPDFDQFTVAATATQISYQGGRSEQDPLLWSAMAPGIDERASRCLLAMHLLLAQEPMRAAA